MDAETPQPTQTRDTIVLLPQFLGTRNLLIHTLWGTSIKPIKLLQPVIELAENAATEILKYYNTEFSIEQKIDNTPLTTADLASHKMIVNGLAQLTTDIPILSEESANIPFFERRQWHTYWLVDPLDGTREFIKRNDEFTINIALVENHQPIMGVIYAPVTKICYHAIKNGGAHKIEKDGTTYKISVRKPALHKPHVVRSRAYLDHSLNIFLDKLGQCEITKMGSSLKSCFVAEGKADIYPRLGPTSEWDTAAAQCIVEEAGGFITTTDMKQLRYNTKDSLLNPHFFVFGDDSIDWSSYI